MVIRCPICGTEIDTDNGITLMPLDDKTVTAAHDCPMCFVTITAEDANYFWGKSADERQKMRREFMNNFIDTIDEMYEEACNEIQRES